MMANLVTDQTKYHAPCKDIDILIDMGNITGAYMKLSPKEVWRVSADGEMRDRFRKLSYVFEMNEAEFFERYNELCVGTAINTSYYEEWRNEYDRLSALIEELQFSNVWVAMQNGRFYFG